MRTVEGPAMRGLWAGLPGRLRALLVYAVALATLGGPALAAHALASEALVNATLPAISNLLSPAQSTFEGTTGGWVNGGGAYVTATVAGAHSGTGSLAITSPAGTGTTSATAVSGNDAASLTPAVPGRRYTSQMWVAAATVGRDVAAGVYFSDKDGKKLGNAIGDVVRDVPGAWSQTPAAIGIAPPATAYVAAGAVIKGPLGGESHVIDDATLTTAPGSSAAVVGPLTTSGRNIVDARGNTVTLRGFNRVGMEGSGDAPGVE